MEGRRKFQKGKPPVIIQKMTQSEVENLAMTGTSEEDVLVSLGMTDRQVERIKKLHRWRKGWDIGIAKLKMKKNAEIMKSNEPTILKLIAERTLPENTITGDTEWVIDAPKWFLDEVKIKNK